MAYSYKVISANSVSSFEEAVQTLLDSTPNDEGYYPIGNMVVVQPTLGSIVFSQSFLRQM